jgi:hypothetical protein
MRRKDRSELRMPAAVQRSTICLLIMPAGTVLFFKTGPFAWNGVAGLYIPLVGFVIWISAISTVIHRRLTERIAAG